ncbi:MAG: MBL fold metallo-hydrolase [Rhodothermales bacterium]
MPVEIQTHPWYHRRHHRPQGGFTNIWDVPRDASFIKSARWLLARPFSQPGKANVPPPVHHLAADALREPPETLRITWLGHAATLIQTPTHTLLTDPMLSRRASPVSFLGPAREAPLPLHADDLPPVDIVLLSHDHYDHLDKRSIQTLQHDHQPLFLAPLGVGAILRGWGATRVAEMDWWQYADVDGLRYHATPAMHFSGRGLTNRDGTLWCGWYVETAGDADVPPWRLYYGGDSGYAGLFGDIRERLGAPNVALFPIGAYRPRWFMRPVHMDPEEAVQAFQDVGAEHFIPIHWGTFDLADEPIQEPAERVRIRAHEQGLEEELHMLDIGTAFTLERTSVPAPSPAGEAS